jgi:ceramide glucosyltransferase
MVASAWLLALMIVAPLLASLVAGSTVFCILVVVAARRYLSVRPRPLTDPFPISILKPLHGVDEGLESNLRTFFEQDYPSYELLFALRNHNDPAIALVSRLQDEYPQIPSRLIVTGEPPYPNAKVYSLDQMMAIASYDVLVMSDSDIRVTPNMLRTVAAEFRDPRLGVATCPYRAVPGRSFWSVLEAIGMNTEFLSGILVARMLEGMRFAVGPTIVARRQCLQEIGGFDKLQQYLAEDFVMGNFAADAGWKVILSSYVIEHHIGTQGVAANAAHRLRWNRSTRRSRPSGYAGQLFTNPFPLVVLLLAVAPHWWMLAAIGVAARLLAAWATAGWVLHDRLTARLFFLIPVQDFLSFVFWLAGFFGNTIEWRGRRYRLLPDGRFELK